MPKVIKTDGNTRAGWKSYQIDFGDGMVLWFDAENTADGFVGDWNMYIFDTTNARDMEIKAFQDANDESGAYNYMSAIEAVEAYESLNK